MNKRAVLSVGCNNYIQLSPLKGAENDAIHLFNCLTEDNHGAYNTALSKQLLSPTLEEFRLALDSVLFAEDGLDVLTIFFAGHGGIKSGSYYLCLSDTCHKRMSTTAFSLNELFTVLNECQPRQINIIIDSCNAGGLVGDLAVLLKPELSGANHSPSIALLAAASSNEFASEVDGNGVVTKLILEYLRGDRQLNTTNKFLDLTEIGRAITNEIDEQHNQTPTIWGLNLFGESQFSKNPHFNEASNTSSKSGFFDILPESDLGKKINFNSESLWNEYRATGEEPNSERLAKILEQIIGGMVENLEGVATFINGISSSLEQQAAKSPDLSGPVTTISTLITVLQKYSDDSAIQLTITSLLSRRKNLLEEFLKNLEIGLNEDKFYLLNKKTVIGDLFFLPIRISKTLGYLWSQVLIDFELRTTNASYIERVTKLSIDIFSFYEGSFVCVSDEQAPYLYTIAKAVSVLNLHEKISPIFNAYFTDLLKHKGNIASIYIPTNKILSFLLNRASIQERHVPQLLANPSQLLAVFLSLDDRLISINCRNKNLIQLDHQSLVVFIPYSYKSFGEEIIHDGVNNTFKIGHGIWSVNDFKEQFQNECLPLIRTAISCNSSHKVLSLVSSVTFPDRIPWFFEINNHHSL
jgi:hypothetical protein